MLQRFIERLQGADDRTKQRWLIFLSAVAMALVLFLWLKYFNALIEPRDAAPGPNEQTFSFWKSLEASAAALWGSAEEALQNLWGAIRRPKEYLITP